MNELRWWGYQHINGTFHVKRFIDPKDIDEAMESPFIAHLWGQISAETRDEAMEVISGTKVEYSTHKKKKRIKLKFGHGDK